jgi:hypothetical protein
MVFSSLRDTLRAMPEKSTTPDLVAGARLRRRLERRGHDAAMNLDASDIHQLQLLERFGA